MKNIILIVCLCSFGALVASISQSCPCPTNSYCLSNNMCACNPGFIGNCSTPATPLSTANISANLT